MAGSAESTGAVRRWEAPGAAESTETVRRWEAPEPTESTEARGLGLFAVIPRQRSR